MAHRLHINWLFFHKWFPNCICYYLLMCALCVLPAAFLPVPTTSGPPPSAVVASSAVLPWTGTADLHTAACLLPCPTHRYTNTNVQPKTRTVIHMHTKWKKKNKKQMRDWTEIMDTNTHTLKIASLGCWFAPFKYFKDKIVDRPFFPTAKCNS